MTISLSYSKLSSYMTCMLKYENQYVKGIKVEKAVSSSQELGKFIHKVLEDYREGLDIFELAAVHEKSYLITEEQKKIVPTMLESAIEFYKPYAGLPFKSEQGYNYIIKDEFGGTEDIKINGIIDKIYYLPDNSLNVIDFKTSKVKSDNSLQLKFYAYLLNKNLGIDPSLIECKIFYIRFDQHVLYKFDMGQLIEFEGFIKAMVESMGRTERFAHNIGYWCKYCDFRNNCEPYKADSELKKIRFSRR